MSDSDMTVAAYRTGLGRLVKDHLTQSALHPNFAPAGDSSRSPNGAEGKRPEAVLAGAAIGGLLALLNRGPSLQTAKKSAGLNSMVPTLPVPDGPE